MAVTHSPAGYTGTVDQVDEARRLALAGGGRFRVASATDWVPSANSGVNRTVNIAAGSGVACGVLDVTTLQDSVTVAANAGGSDRLDVVVATWDWSALTVTFRVIQGTTVIPAIVRTGTTVDTTKINWLPGTRYDAVIAVVRVRPSVTILAPTDIYDSRLFGSWSMLSAVSDSFPGAFDVDAGGRVLGTANSRRWEFDGTSWLNVDCQGLLYGTGTQAVGDSLYSIPIFTVSAIADGIVVDTANSRLRFLRAGTYLVSGGISFSGNATGRRLAAIYKNGVIDLRSQGMVFPTTTNSSIVPTATIPMKVAVNDYVQVAGYQDSGGNLNFLRDSCFISAVRQGD